MRKAWAVVELRWAKALAASRARIVSAVNVESAPLVHFRKPSERIATPVLRRLTDGVESRMKFAAAVVMFMPVSVSPLLVKVGAPDDPLGTRICPLASVTLVPSSERRLSVSADEELHLLSLLVVPEPVTPPVAAWNVGNAPAPFDVST